MNTADTPHTRRQYGPPPLDASTGLAIQAVLRDLPGTTRFLPIRLLGHIVGRCIERGGSYQASAEQLARIFNVRETVMRRAIAQVKRFPRVTYRGGPGRVAEWQIEAPAAEVSR